MRRRMKMRKRNSRSVFRRGATAVHPKNLSVGPMRGGIRL